MVSDIRSGQKKAILFDKTNPYIFINFAAICHGAIKRGVRRWSAKAVWEIMRWESLIAGQDDTYKLRNDYHAYYARKFVKEYPEHQGFFEFRASQFDVDEPDPDFQLDMFE